MRIIVHEKDQTSFPHWQNKNSPLPMQYDTLSEENLLTIEESFPLLADFEVVLETWDERRKGYDVLFFSEEQGGNIADTYFDDYRLRQKDFSPPLNFVDLDQGWVINIVAKGSFVYVWEGDWDHRERGILRWFKVARERYIQEWQEAIEASTQFSNSEEIRLRFYTPRSLYRFRKFYYDLKEKRGCRR